MHRPYEIKESVIQSEIVQVQAHYNLRTKHIRYANVEGTPPIDRSTVRNGRNPLSDLNRAQKHTHYIGHTHTHTPTHQHTNTGSNTSRHGGCRCCRRRRFGRIYFYSFISFMIIPHIVCVCVCGCASIVRYLSIINLNRGAKSEQTRIPVTKGRHSIPAVQWTLSSIVSSTKRSGDCCAAV